MSWYFVQLFVLSAFCLDFDRKFEHIISIYDQHMRLDDRWIDAKNTWQFVQAHQEWLIIFFPQSLFLY